MTPYRPGTAAFRGASRPDGRPPKRGRRSHMKRARSFEPADSERVTIVGWGRPPHGPIPGATRPPTGGAACRARNASASKRRLVPESRGSSFACEASERLSDEGANSLIGPGLSAGYGIVAGVDLRLPGLA